MNRLIASGLMAVGLVGQVCAAPISGQGTWETTLLPRYYDGEVVAYYDTALNITWQASLTSNPYNTTGPTLFTPCGGAVFRCEWDGWAPIIAGKPDFGVTGWRLPRARPLGAEWDRSPTTSDFGYAIAGEGWGTRNELGHLYYVTFGNSASSGGSGPYAEVNSGPLGGFDYDRIPPGLWTQELIHYGPVPFGGGSYPYYGVMFFDGGSFATEYYRNKHSALLVVDGDPLRPVPLPAALPLFLAGGAALVGAGVRRRHR